ncbi:MAG: transcription elongation factor GreA [Eubacterium sp.]|nr:transcription elongation factor GreA [Eubacterium sp.]
MHDKLTQSDIDRMQEEIDHRKLVVRRQALEDLKEARAHGDLSENFEYHAAKRFKNQNESRIRYLENMIKTAVIIEADAEDGVAGLQKRVVVRIDGEEEEETYKIVTAVRGNSLKGLITGESPLGAALLGHRAGDRVHVDLGGGRGYDLEILAVLDTEGEEEDDLRKY